MDILIGATQYQAPRPQHKHKTHEIIVYTHDSGMLWTSCGEYSVSPGSIAVIPPGIAHNTLQNSTLKSIWIQGNFSHILNFDEPKILMDNGYADGINLAKMMLRSQHEDSDFTAVLCNGFLHFILKNLRFDDEIRLAVSKIVQQMTDNFYDQNLNPCDLLRQSGYAEDYIRSKFRQITGKTPTAFLTELRIRHACYLIDIYRNSLPLTDIASQCGYADYVLFSKRFKSVMHISPREYKCND